MAKTMEVRWKTVLVCTAFILPVLDDALYLQQIVFKDQSVNYVLSYIIMDISHAKQRAKVIYKEVKIINT